jgi:hypothetical protein
MGLLNYTIAKINELLGKVDKMPETVRDGKTPVLETGTTTTLSPAESATSEIVRNGEDSNGNPRYKINLGIPKGRDGSGGSGGGVADSVDWSNVLNKPSWVNSITKPTYTASDVGALPADTIIPSKTSQLINDSKFVEETGLKMINGQSLIGSGNIIISEGSGGGNGNVSVTNASSLVKGRLYAFNPSVNGSADGVFSMIPMASSSEAGLIDVDLYDKIYQYKDIISFPVTVLNLTAASSSDDILTAFGINPVDNNMNLAYIIMTLASAQSVDYESSFPKCFIGNHECFAYASIESTAYTLELSYIGQGGVLKTVNVIAKKGSDGMFTYSAYLSESGDDEVYLPSSILGLTTTSTHEEVEAMFDSLGGIEHVIGLAQKAKTKFYIVNSSSNATNMRSFVNMGGYIIANIFYYIKISYIDTYLISHLIIINGTKSDYKIKSKNDIDIRYTIGYKSLKPEVYALKSSSTSDEISSAFSGETEFKAAIEAVKNGAILRTSIPESIGLDYTNPVYLNTFFAYVNNNGNATLGYIITGDGISDIIGMRFVMINYEASSDSFSIGVVPFTIGG